ncbi:LodA/GoxA family CTQ-dependent oxidase [Chitinophaga sp. Cy-1792]|uniref:LodA/GoxA family CTQ-dependent oxidase n=1 Tax=Chitinophaga sp. Cy-1792 TaxID=2608339 RepID=UPI0014237FA6|nr:LodA/GoxA family CTQ-dependent oxidase [Chitinophaga sp. Cy-1792]
MAEKAEYARMAIYPPLGIARVGNSDEYFLAPDVPGIEPPHQNGYKDNQGRIKKQVPRFRIYAFDENNNPVKEITADANTTIEWRVNLANRKSSWYDFENAADLPDEQSKTTEHRNIKETDRSKLNILPKPKTIKGINQSGVLFNEGYFYDINVPLGEIRTDDKGRLLVIPADGTSASAFKEPPTTFANNVGWHDDTADGTIFASVTIGNATYQVKPAMVAVTPPNFGPGLFAVVTMYDVVEDLFLQSGEIPKPAQLEFWKHIYPIISRTVQTQWVNHGFYMLFGQNSPSDYLMAENFAKLMSPDPIYRDFRTKVFQWYRDPENKDYTPVKIPPFYGDAFGDYEDVFNVDLPLTKTQYERMAQWAQGHFVVGNKAGTDFDKFTLEQQIQALIEAPLEECLGGPFHPGIEITWPFRQRIFWAEPFRIKLLPENVEPKDDYGKELTPEVAVGPNGPIDGSGPGSLTRWLGVPWQTDEASCLSGYDTTTYLMLPSFWAARVPNQVLSESSFQRLTDKNLNINQRLKHFDYRQDWLRDLGTQYLPKLARMVEKWHYLGIITEVKLEADMANPALPNTLWVETGRPGFTTEDPTFDQVLIAEHAQPPLLQKARAILRTAAGVDASQLRILQRKPFRRDEM